MLFAVLFWLNLECHRVRSNRLKLIQELGLIEVIIFNILISLSLIMSPETERKYIINMVDRKSVEIDQKFPPTVLGHFHFAS